ncbi:MAG: hypothetical protein HY908_23355, partial [Myxococcales bacterium]|nr:hypothetical protein [Myxococcales bacterium]
MNAWYLRNGDSEPVGPVATELVVRGIQAGKVPPDAEVALEFPDGMSPWRPLESVPEFAAALYGGDPGGLPRGRLSRPPPAVQLPKPSVPPVRGSGSAGPAHRGAEAPVARDPGAIATSPPTAEPEAPARIAGYVHAEWYVQEQGANPGSPVGPLSTAEIMRRISAWTISPGALVALVSPYGSADWRPLDAVEEFAAACRLAQELGHPPAPPPAAPSGSTLPAVPPPVPLPQPLPPSAPGLPPPQPLPPPSRLPRQPAAVVPTPLP